MIKFQLLNDYLNVFDMIPKEFSADEIEEIRTVFPKVYSKKRASLHNPDNILGEVCQWHDDKLYCSFGYEVEIVITSGKVSVSWFSVRYDRTGDLSFLPRQYGLCSTDYPWSTTEDLVDIKERLRV